MPLAVQECLRLEGPILFNWRILHEDYEFSGTTIPAGAQIWAMMASGNRDAAHFPDPDRFDISRTDTDHLSFGGGRHWCLGQHLARIEAEIAFTTFFDRARNVRLDNPGHTEWSSSFFRIPGSMPVSFDPA
jgi:cytochrome P450